MNTKIRVLPIVLTVGIIGMAYGALAAQETAPQEMIRSARATVRNSDGAEIGVVVFTPYEGGKVTVTADLENLTPGFHGFHIHGAGECDTHDDMDFDAAGPHLDLDGASHPDHAGDLPPLLVTEDGEAFFSVRTDRFTIDDLLDENGSAVMIHADPDNFAHFPERYAVTPDEDTLNTGDAGERVACGPLEEWMAENLSSSTAVPTDGTMVPTQDPNMMATSENAETPLPAETNTDGTDEPLTATPDGASTATPETDITPVATIVDTIETPTLPPQ